MRCRDRRKYNAEKVETEAKDGSSHADVEFFGDDGYCDGV